MIKPYKLYYKRILDISFSLFIIFITSPLFILLFIACTISTKEIGLFAHKRIGLEGKVFKLYKFKTMTGKNSEDKGIATLSKSRITPLGSKLRKTHLDELPQFFMVLLGSMSLVGPRPEVPQIINILDNKDSSVFTSIRPGLISPASLKYIHEEKILENSKDPESFYMNVIMPDKLKMNREYISDISFKNDLKIFLAYFLLIMKLK